MSRWVVVMGDNAVGKDGVFYHGLDLSGVPDNLIAVQVYDGVNAEIEYGDLLTEQNDSNEETPISNIAWWSVVSSAWQAAEDQRIADEAAAASEEEVTP
jgi:hypothetical protein